MTGPPRFAAWLTAHRTLFRPFVGESAVGPLFRHGARESGRCHAPDKAATHPALLDLLESEFKASGFQQKHLIRAICNSATYRATSRPLKENAQDRELFSHMQMKLLSPTR